MAAVFKSSKKRVTLPPILPRDTPTLDLSTSPESKPRRLDLTPKPTTNLGTLFPFKFPEPYSAKSSNSKTISMKDTSVSEKILKLSFPTLRFSTEPTPKNMDKKLLKKISFHDELVEVEREEVSEENLVRHRRVIAIFRELNLIRVEDCDNMIIRDAQIKVKNREKIIKLAESILNLYNINVVFNVFPKKDSVMKVDGMSERDQLVYCYKAIISEIVKFPYSFLKNIGLSTLTFADNVTLYKPANHPSAMKKLYTGLFPLLGLPTRDDKRKHFYKTIVFMMKEKVAEMDDEWLQINPIPPREDLINRIFGIGPSSNSRSLIQEQSDVLKEIMKSPSEYVEGETPKKALQGAYFKHALESIDPIGITMAWWTEVEVFDRMNRVNPSSLSNIF
jgi:hypothetical protein